MRTRPVTIHYFKREKELRSGHACTIETAVVAAVRNSYKFTTAQIRNGHGILKVEISQSANGVTHISRAGKWPTHMPDKRFPFKEHAGREQPLLKSTR